MDVAPPEGFWSTVHFYDLYLSRGLDLLYSTVEAHTCVVNEIDSVTLITVI